MKLKQVGIFIQIPFFSHILTREPWAAMKLSDGTVRATSKLSTITTQFKPTWSSLSSPSCWGKVKFQAASYSNPRWGFTFCSKSDLRKHPHFTVKPQKNWERNRNCTKFKIISVYSEAFSPIPYARKTVKISIMVIKSVINCTMYSTLKCDFIAKCHKLL